MAEDDGEGHCAKCGTELMHDTCPGCGGGGVTGHDCGEDTCVCADPYDNVECEQCGGTGTIPFCEICETWELRRKKV